MSKLLRLLIVEDSDDDAQLLLMNLQRSGYQVASERVETPSALREALKRKEWDLVICDYSLPYFNAPQALDILHESGMDLPFIIVSGTIGEETAVTALKAGAHDFLIKGNYARLVPAIERELKDAENRRRQRQAEEELREKERLLSESQRVAHIGSCSYNLASDAMQYSDEMYRLLGVSPQGYEPNSQTFLALVYSPDRPAVEKWLKDIKSGRLTGELDFRILQPNGELRYLQCRGALTFDPSGKPLRFIGTMQDVTERKLAEIQIRQQVSRLLALRKVDQAIASNFDLRVTLNVLISQVIEQLNVDAAAILLLDEEHQMLDYFTGRGFRTTAIENRLPVEGSHAGRAVLHKRMVRIPDLLEQPLVRSFAGEDFVCYFGVPLINKGKVSGVLEVFHRTPLQPYPEWLDFFETLAGQAAIAIDNAMLFENLQRTNYELERAYDATIEGWSHALDLRDKETEGHTQRVTDLTLRLARAMGIEDEEELLHIRWGGLLHDIGKMGVPDKILLKKGSLSGDEWETMRRHPRFAFEWLAPIAYLLPALEIPYCHHEKWDGTGYPRGLKGEAIPLPARIFAVADVWDALTSDRHYRRAWSKEKALEYIRENRGKHFDPQVVDVFLKHIAAD